MTLVAVLIAIMVGIMIVVFCQQGGRRESFVDITNTARQIFNRDAAVLRDNDPRCWIKSSEGTQYVLRTPGMASVHGRPNTCYFLEEEHPLVDASKGGCSASPLSNRTVVFASAFSNRVRPIESMFSEISMPIISIISLRQRRSADGMAPVPQARSNTREVLPGKARSRRIRQA